MSNITIIGHLTIDLVRPPKLKDFFLMPGGPPFYSLFAIGSLEGAVTILSKVGGDYPKSFVKEMEGAGAKLLIEREAGAATTKFVIEYFDGSRSLKLLASCGRLPIWKLEGLGRIECVQLSPVDWEISEDDAFKVLGKSEFSALDPQGFLRDAGRGGRIKGRRWLNARVLRHVDVFKCSMEELKAVTGILSPSRALARIAKLGPKLCIATSGRRGSILLEGKKAYQVPSFPSQKVVNPTGAGDVFIGGFLTKYLDEGDANWAASVGSALASIRVEKLYMSEVRFNEREVMERAKFIHERIKLFNKL